MITQVYGITSIEDALGSIEAGTDYIGIGVKKEGVSLEQCREIFAAVGDRTVKVAILDMILDDEQAVLDAARFVKPDILHLSENIVTSAAFYKKFQEQLPGMKLMQAVPVSGPEAVDFALEHMACADYFILDSVNASGGIGAAGTTHDLNIDAEIVRRSTIPVVIAGGLGPDNVAAAIEVVKPFGVDTLSKTNIDNDRKKGKDIEKVRAFCLNTRKAAEKLGL